MRQTWLKKMSRCCLMSFRNKKLNAYVMTSSNHIWTYLVYNIHLITNINTYQTCISLYWKQLNIQCQNQWHHMSYVAIRGLQTISRQTHVTSRRKPRNTKSRSSIYETTEFLPTRTEIMQHWTKLNKGSPVNLLCKSPSVPIRCYNHNNHFHLSSSSKSIDCNLQTFPGNSPDLLLQSPRSS